MSPSTIFEIANTTALLAWLLLIIVPNFAGTKWVVRSGVVSLCFALAYAWFLLGNFSLDMEGFEAFSTLEGIMALNGAPELALAGWLHYLAFDLMIGIWEVGNAQKHGLPHWLIIPALFFTFMLGPTGLLLYFITRSIYLRKLVLTVD